MSSSRARARSSGPQAVRRQGLADSVYDQLSGLILSLQIPPGSKLRIDHLAEQFGVSSTPVRDALRRLTGQGIVRFEPYIGFSVREAPTVDELRDSYQARECIEVFAVAHAAKRITPSQLRELEASARRLADLDVTPDIKSLVGYLDANHEFHELLLRASGNRFLLRAWQDLRHDEIISMVVYERGVPDRAEVIAEHEAVLAALRAGNVRASSAALRTHILRGAERLVSDVGGRDATRGPASAGRAPASGRSPGRRRPAR